VTERLLPVAVAYTLPAMRIKTIARVILPLLGVIGSTASGHADESEKLVKKAVERSTLNQSGTKPFHLKAVLAPSFERDRGSYRTGEVEMWWTSPTHWRREVRSPEFHQVAIVNGGREWQRNEGEYFPEWLRETSIALIEPVPSLDEVLKQVKDAEIRRLMGSTYFNWMMMSTDGKVEKGMGAGLAVKDSTGLLLYGGGLGWGGSYKHYKSFHDRMVAQTVSVGSPEVTAKIVTLEDLRDTPAGLFDTEVAGGDVPLLRTVEIDEKLLRKNLLPMEPVEWPVLKDGPLEGAITTKIVVDRQGKVRELGSILSDNPGLVEAAGKTIASMQFRPYLQDGAAVQVISRITMPFKTVRPAGVETFDSAHNYFERGRRRSFPAAGSGPPYILRATFQVRVAAGTIENGQYVDTWKDEGEWCREATVGKSRFVRARHGEKRYRWAEGPDDGVLAMVLRAMEPIPAIDTFVESDWRMKWDTVDGMKTIRVLAGYESPDGTLDPEQARGYWFDESGRLVKAYFRGIETQRADFKDFGDVAMARQIRVLHDHQLGMLIRITEVSAAATMPENVFDLRGHDWKRAFTDEVR
jgi:hypothetical protein